MHVSVWSVHSSLSSSLRLHLTFHFEKDYSQYCSYSLYSNHTISHIANRVV